MHKKYSCSAYCNVLIRFVTTTTTTGALRKMSFTLEIFVFILCNFFFEKQNTAVYIEFIALTAIAIDSLIQSHSGFSIHEKNKNSEWVENFILSIVIIISAILSNQVATKYQECVINSKKITLKLNSQFGFNFSVYLCN